jgi:hypothetical protein
MEKNYRRVSPSEVAQMESRGSTCDDWGRVWVADGFDATYIEQVCFGGTVRLGATGGRVLSPDGVERRAGIRHAEIIDSTVGDGVFISRIGAYIAGCDIGDGAYIEDTGKIVSTGRSTFGNGVRAAVLNEGGGREVAITDRLTAQLAYFMSMYRHRPRLIEALEAMARRHTEPLAGGRGVIGRGAVVVGCGGICDVRVGDHAVVRGAVELTNGTVLSSADRPSLVGSSVRARDFVCAVGSSVDNGAVIVRCFVGEGVQLGTAFTAADSLFFANSHFENGEAASVFAAPFAVSHHRSTLLIAGYFELYNAGSGTNQSNHLFRTGAVHQGIHERGVKTASNAYIMLPAREGPFTVVVGRHRNHHDTADFPYSYLVEEEGNSCLVPAANLTSSGMTRDLEKWPRRDRRGEVRSDIVDLQEWTPYIGERVARAIGHSERMLAREDVTVFNFNRTRIRRAVLLRGLKLYRQAFAAALGEILARGADTARQADRHWVDVAGMVAPHGEVERILDRVESGDLATFDDVGRELHRLHGECRDHAHAWAVAMLADQLGHAPSATEIEAAIAAGRAAGEHIAALRAANARQDADAIMATGYGIDALDGATIAADFRAVRGVALEQ